MAKSPLAGFLRRQLDGGHERQPADDRARAAVPGIKQAGVLGARINRFRVPRVYRHAGQRPIGQVALRLAPLLAVLLKAMPPRKGRRMQRLFAVCFAHDFLPWRSADGCSTVLALSAREWQMSAVSSPPPAVA